jgi:hypothetical protein
MELSTDGRTLFFRENNGISKMALATRTKTPVRFVLNFAVDKREEWREMFDEFYRHWKYSYVEEDMHGFDWAAIRRRYESLVDKIGQTDDFYMLGAEMLNELNSSHSGITAPADPDDDTPAGPRRARGRWWSDPSESDGVPGDGARAGRTRPQGILHLQGWPSGQGVAKREGRRLRHGHQRHEARTDRQLLETPHWCAQRVGERHRGRRP